MYYDDSFHSYTIQDIHPLTLQIDDSGNELPYMYVTKHTNDVSPDFYAFVHACRTPRWPLA